ncbi:MULTISPECIES: RNA polymerase sigma factor [unclassified Microbacterium]|uniref:RNA polymerase sigma factor n=1 Tax=unclassified Microbacterium TaxID=2609290 RepID=UPI003665A3CD
MHANPPGAPPPGIPADTRRAAFEALFAEHHTAVLRYVERRVDDREHARELAMDCFEIAWRRFDEREPYRRPWLLQTARNLVGDAYRKRDREREGLRDLATSARQNDDAAHVELRHALSLLRHADREVIELHYWDGLSADEIAEVVGCRTAAAWKRLSRARTALRLLLQEPAADAPPRPDPDPGSDRNPSAPTPRKGVMTYAAD